MAGIFIIEGMKLHLSRFTISFDAEGNLTSDGPTVEVAYDACIAWARIATAHRSDAIRRMEERRATWEQDPAAETTDSEAANEKARALEEEFRSSMQAVVAAATCIDALYDHMLSFAGISEKTRAAWLKNKTARHTQVVEVLRAALRIKPQEVELLKTNLAGIYKLRDASVHPPSATRPPHKHPELDIATDWRLTTFRGDVADMIVCFALGLLWDVTRGTKYKSKKLQNFMISFRERVEKLLPEGRPNPICASVNFYIPPSSQPSQQEASERS